MGLQVTSEGPVRITRATIEAAWKRRAKNARLVIRDMECRGLALVVNTSTMSWTFSYKPRGVDAGTGKRFPTQSVTIGGPATHSPEQARSEANRAKDKAKGGSDPAAEKKALQAAETTRRAATISRLIDGYASDLPKRPKLRGSGLPSADYVADELAHLRAAAAIMRVEQKPAADVDAADLRLLLRADAGRPALVRHRFGAVSRFFDWCLDEGHVKANPSAGVSKGKRPKAPKARNRFLTAAQVAHLWKSAEGMEEPVHRDYARFLMVVPGRRNEAARMDWSHVDLDAATWDQPDKLTKNGDPHRIHLPSPAMAILRRRHEEAGEPRAGYVFPAPRSRKALTTFSAIKVELDKLAGFTAWAWHDLRRTFATALGEAGFSEVVADAVLNHRQAATRGGVLGVYQQSERWGERKAAMDSWGKILTAAIDGKPPAEIVTDLAAEKARHQAAG
jgi:integrase